MKPRFTLEELKETLKKMDLTVRPMTEAAMEEYKRLDEEMRPYREATEKVM